MGEATIVLFCPCGKYNFQKQKAAELALNVKVGKAPYSRSAKGKLSYLAAFIWKQAQESFGKACGAGTLAPVACQFLGSGCRTARAPCSVIRASPPCLIQWTKRNMRLPFVPIQGTNPLPLCLLPPNQSYAPLHLRVSRCKGVLSAPRVQAGTFQSFLVTY